MASLGLLGAVAGIGRGVEDYGKGRMTMALDDIKAERLAQAAEAERAFRSKEKAADRAFSAERQERGFEVQGERDRLSRKHDLTRDERKYQFTGEQSDLGREHDLTRDERKYQFTGEQSGLDRAAEAAKDQRKAAGNPYDKELRNDLIDVETEYDRRIQDMIKQSELEGWDDKTYTENKAVIDGWRSDAQSRVRRTWEAQDHPAPSASAGEDGDWTDPETGKTWSRAEIQAELARRAAGKDQPGPRKDKPTPESPAPRGGLIAGAQAAEETSDYVAGVEQRSRPGAPAPEADTRPMAERLRAMRAEKRPAEAARERIEAAQAQPVAAFEERFRELFGALSEGRGDAARTAQLLAEAQALLEEAPSAARKRALEQIIADLSS